MKTSFNQSISQSVNHLKLFVLFLFLSPAIFAQTVGNWQYNSPLFRFQSSLGYLELGTSTSSTLNFNTDRTRFHFNRPIISETGIFGAGSVGTGRSLYFNTNISSTKMTILYTNGNVGIGTTNPVEKLHVNGHILVPSDFQMRFGTENNSSGSFTIGNAGSAYNTYCEIEGNLYFKNVTRNPYNMVRTAMGIQNDGSVTIGVWEKYTNDITPTDGHKLMVNGGILCESLKIIEDVPNADYVFEDNYKLMTLEQVASFVKNNKHLPNIPSAAEFTECGYKVGEMDEMLLRKVEELTLYMIQLNEEVAKLKKENEALRVKTGM